MTEWQFLDYSNERSTVRIKNGAVTAVSIGGFLTAVGTMRTALEGITLGTISKEKWIGDDTLISNELPANAFAQREFKWLVRYHGNTSQDKMTLTIPTADYTNRLIPGTDRADLTDAGIAAFVTAFEAFARSDRDDTETVTVDEIVVVGRNL